MVATVRQPPNPANYAPGMWWGGTPYGSPRRNEWRVGSNGQPVYSPFSLSKGSLALSGSKAAIAAAQQTHSMEHLFKLQQASLGVGPTGTVAANPYLKDWKRSVGQVGGPLPSENALVSLAQRLSAQGKYVPQLERAIRDYQSKNNAAYGQQRAAAYRIRDQEQAHYQRGLGAYNEALTAARQHDPNFYAQQARNQVANSLGYAQMEQNNTGLNAAARAGARRGFAAQGALARGSAHMGGYAKGLSERYNALRGLSDMNPTAGTKGFEAFGALADNPGGQVGINAWSGLSRDRADRANAASGIYAGIDSRRQQGRLSRSQGYAGLAGQHENKRMSLFDAYGSLQDRRKNVNDARLKALTAASGYYTGVGGLGKARATNWDPRT